MTTALWCLLIAGLLPYAFTIAAKTGREFTNRAPREYLDRVEGWRQRAHWAQLNSFEGLPLFVAAVLTSHVLAGAQASADIAALTYVFMRAVYGAAYIADRPSLRSFCWFVAMGANVALFVIAARAA